EYVCPSSYRISCASGRQMECCSSSDCPSGKVCCKFHCTLSCINPEDGTQKEEDNDKEECQKLKDGEDDKMFRPKYLK
ncbi:hypothetical protein TNCT_593731, partial [Trichonephila clavata]